MMRGNEPLGWLLSLQMLQSRHDTLYCGDVFRMSPMDRTHYLVTLMSKYVFEIQRDAYTTDLGGSIGKRVTDMIITTTSLMTALNVDMCAMLQKLNSTASDEFTLMQWLKDNYVYTLGQSVNMSAAQLYHQRMEYTVALPIYMSQMVDAVSSMILMSRDTKTKPVITNAAMHLWIQCVISHAMHGHRSFTDDIRDRLNEVERKNIMHKAYGLYPAYNVVQLA
jgi:hypothetical protein